VSDDNVIKVEFGGRYKTATDMLAKLMQLSEQRANEIRSDPVAFLDLAYERMIQMRRQMADASDALRAPLASFAKLLPPDEYLKPIEWVRVPLEEYEAFKKAEEIIRSWNL